MKYMNFVLIILLFIAMSYFTSAQHGVNKAVLEWVQIQSKLNASELKAQQTQMIFNKSVIELIQEVAQ